MKIYSLNSIIDDILLEVRNSNIAESEHLSRIQIEQWIHAYRAKLIKEDLDKGRDVNPSYVQVFGPIHISKVEESPGHYEYVSDITIPNVLDLHFGTGISVIKDLQDNLIQIGNETKAKLQKYRKYTCNDYIAYIKNKHVYLTGPGYLEWIQIEGIFEDPTSIGDCFDADNSVYPIPANMIPVVKQLIFANELNVMMQVNTDTTNNSSDDNLTSAGRVRSTYERGEQ